MFLILVATKKSCSLLHWTKKNVTRNEFQNLVHVFSSSKFKLIEKKKEIWWRRHNAKIAGKFYYEKPINVQMYIQYIAVWLVFNSLKRNIGIVARSMSFACRCQIEDCVKICRNFLANIHNNNRRSTYIKKYCRSLHCPKTHTLRLTSFYYTSDWQCEAAKNNNTWINMILTPNID